MNDRTVTSRTRIVVFAPMLVAAVLMIAAPASAGTTYTATTSGEWDDPATWGGSTPPLVVGSGDSVVIPTGLTVGISASVTVDLAGTLTIEGTLDINPAGELEMSSPGAIENHGTLDIKPRGILESSGGSFDNHGNVVMRFFQTATSRYLNSGSGEFINHFGAHVELGGLLSTASDAALVNHGTIELLRSNFFRGRISLTGFGTFDNYGDVTVEDTVQMLSSSATTYNHPGASITITDVGDFVAGPGLLVNDSGIQNGGELFNDTGGAIHQLCNGTITGNSVIGAAPIDQCDTSPPVISTTVSGSLGDNGWYTSTVEISWTVSDPESLLLDTSGCGTTFLVADTPGITYTCDATSYGGTNAESVTIKRDTVAPIATATASPPPNADGWHNTQVVVTFTGTDSLSGLAGCDVPVPLATDGAGQSATGECTDNAGNVGSDTDIDIDIDTTPPVVSFLGNAGPYDVLDTVAIGCSASDALSGIDTSLCPTASGPAYTFDLENPNVLEATATDLARNTTIASTSFTVVVTRAGVLQLVEELIDQPHEVRVQTTIDTTLGFEGIRQLKLYEKLARDLNRMVKTASLTQEEADILVELVGILCDCS